MTTHLTATEHHIGIQLTASLRRRWPTALGLGATAVTLPLVLRLPATLSVTVSAWSVLLAGVIYLAWGSARGDLTSARRLAAQTAAVLVLGAAAVAAAALEQKQALYLLAAAWFGHALWDLVHHRLNAVVPRWYAETCLASDLLVTAGLLFTAR